MRNTLQCATRVVMVVCYSLLHLNGLVYDSLACEHSNHNGTPNKQESANGQAVRHYQVHYLPALLILRVR